MCTAVVRLDPDAAWPILVAFVRDEERGRDTDPPGFWWPEYSTFMGGRDRRAGGTWLAVDVDKEPGGQVAFVQNQIGPHVSYPEPISSPSRGALPLIGLEWGYAFDPDRHLPFLERYQPFHLVTARFEDDDMNEVDWWRWSGTKLEHTNLQPGIHLIASRGLDLPGERERRATHLARFANAPDPTPDPDLDPHAAWGDWIDLLDGRDATPGDLGGIVLHSVPERPEFGTVGATLVGIAADGRVRYDINATTTVSPEAWSQVHAASASMAT